MKYENVKHHINYLTLEDFDIMTHSIEILNILILNHKYEVLIILILGRVYFQRLLDTNIV